MLWAFVTRLNDILAVIGFGTVIFWMGRGVLAFERWRKRRAGA
jgi:hypothetical protein